MEWALAILFWVGCGVAAAFIAAAKHRSAPAWFLGGALFGPLGLLVIACLPADGAAALQQRVDIGDLRKCPMCAELIKAEAQKCRFCGSAIEPVLTETPEIPAPAEVVVQQNGDRYAIVVMVVIVAIAIAITIFK